MRAASFLYSFFILTANFFQCDISAILEVALNNDKVKLELSRVVPAYNFECVLVSHGVDCDGLTIEIEGKSLNVLSDDSFLDKIKDPVFLKENMNLLLISVDELDEKGKVNLYHPYSGLLIIVYVSLSNGEGEVEKVELGAI